MEKKILYTEREPNTNFLWLHTKNNALVLEAFGIDGWNTVSENKSAEIIELKEYVKKATAPSPIKVSIPKIDEDCSKTDLINAFNTLKSALVKANIIKL